MLCAGDRVGDFVLREPLGTGGFATVWLAEDEGRSNSVAIKVLHPELLDPEVGGGDVAARFIKEARLLRRLEHPGLVGVLSVIDDRDRGVVAFAMERLVGRNLAEAIDDLGLVDVLLVFVRVVEILEAVHAEGVLHRDIKPSNIFLCRTKEVKLLDLGVAKDLITGSAGDSTATGVVVGSLQNMAPEYLATITGDDAKLTPAIDQWGVGTALFQCLTGYPPFSATTVAGALHQVLHAPVPPLEPLSQYRIRPLPTELERVVLRCLEKRPLDRFHDLRALAAELRGVVHTLEKQGRRPAAPPDRMRTMVSESPTDGTPVVPEPTQIDATLPEFTRDSAAPEPIWTEPTTPAGQLPELTHMARPRIVSPPGGGHEDASLADTSVPDPGRTERLDFPPPPSSAPDPLEDFTGPAAEFPPAMVRGRFVGPDRAARDAVVEPTSRAAARDSRSDPPRQQVELPTRSDPVRVEPRAVTSAPPFEVRVTPDRPRVAQALVTIVWILIGLLFGWLLWGR